MALTNSDLPKLIELLNQIDIRVQVRRRTATEWAANDEVLLAGEWGKVTDTGEMKQGDGVTAFSALMPVPGVLVDPGSDRLLFWDASAGSYRHLSPGSGLAIIGDTITASGGGGGSSFDPSTGTEFFDDFLGRPPAGTGSNATANWRADQIDGSLAQFDAGAANPGVWRLATSTGATSATSMSRGNGVNNITFGGGEIFDEWRIRVPVLSTSAQRCFYFAGYRDVWSGAHTNALTCSYVDNLNGGAFFLRARVAGVDTDYAGTTAVVAGTWYRIKIAINAAGTSAGLYINGVLEATAPSIPTAAMRSGMLINSTVGTTPKNLDADFFKFSQTLTAAR